MIVLDTTILVYATGAEHPLRDPSRALVEEIRVGRITATTTPEVIQEFLHVAARRRLRPEAADLARFYARLLAPLRSVGDGELLLGLQLFEDYPRLGAFDAMLAAVAIGSGAEGLASADKGFAAVRGIRHLDPAAGFAELLGS